MPDHTEDLLNRFINHAPKHEPPFGFSYPIGGRAIGEQLVDLPQFQNFSLRYSAITPLIQKNWDLPGFPLLRLRYSNYPVYNPRPSAVPQRSQGGIQWFLEVVAAPKDRREDLQAKILAEALPLLRGWITGPDTPQSSERNRVMEVWWFDDTGTMKVHDQEIKRRQKEAAREAIT